MMKLIMFALAILLATSAAKAKETFWYYGQGATPCGEYATARKENPKGFKSGDYLIWCQGFLSGMSNYTKTDILKGQSPDSILVWLDNHCVQHPLRSFGDACVLLGNELLSRIEK